MSMSAKYKGWCPACEQPITEGDEIERSSDGRYVHVDCPDDPASTRLTDRFCPKCFMVMPICGICDCG